MVNKFKIVAIIEAIVIISLLVLLEIYYSSQKPNNQQSLLAPKICSGLDEPKSFSILDFSPLQEEIQNYIGKSKHNISVYVKNYRNGAAMGINANYGYFPASLNKLPVAILVMEKIENGELTLDTMLNITEADRKNSSGDLYKTKEKKISVRVLLDKMLKESDNTAFSVLLGNIDQNDLKLLLDYYGIDIYANYHVKTFSIPSFNSYISPRLMYNVFSSLYFSTVLEPQNSQYILSRLTNTVFDLNKLANLPDNVVVSQKFGESYTGGNKYFHSCGIMYIGRSRIFYCIMTKGIPADEAKKAVGDITHNIFEYTVQTRAKLDQYKLYVENS